MDATDRLDDERAFHDRQAGQRRATFARQPERLVFADDDYLDHETWVRPALERLGDVRGLQVLDYGCGHGMAAVVLARRGGWVTAFDLSDGYVAEAGARARANGAAVDLVQADGHRLPFADGSFDRVWGHAVLHHLDVPRAACELRRVLRPGGVAVFCEPWGGNPLLRWAREHWPYPGKERTAGEAPLVPGQLEQLREVFGEVEVNGYQLLGMVRRLGVPGRLARLLDRVDSRLLRGRPRLARWCRYTVLTLRG